MREREPRLVLVNFENDEVDKAPILGFCCIAAYLKRELQYGNICAMSFVYTENIENIISRILDESPDIVGFRTLTAYIALTNKLAKRLKEDHDLPILYGGPHISSLPNDLSEYVDINVIGEGEEVMRELMEVYLKHGHFPPEELKHILSITFRDQDKIVFTGYRKKNLPMETLPMPDYSISKEDCFVPRERWLRMGRPGLGVPYLASRGCTYRCTFC